MKSLSHGKYVYLLLTVIVLLSVAITPKPAHAWSAVTVEAEGSLFNPWNIFRNIVSFFTGREIPQAVIKDIGTHQMMMKLAYQLLEKDPAYIDQKEYFPTIDGILEWEGVVAKTDRVILEGGEWSGRKTKSGGPDAAGKSKDSYHYFNARLQEGQRGNADTSVEKHFKELLLQMYSQGDFYKREKPNDDTNHNAAWAAHYLRDTYVAHHTVGRFKEGMQVGKLTSAEAGPVYLYDYETAKLVGTDINPDSIVQPPEWSGLNNDFSDIYSYYRKYRAVEDKDWFDPWYYNGPYWSNKIRAGPNLVLGSHQSWESWAHGYITDNNLAKVPAAYSEDWKNATPEFNHALSNIEKQAAMAKEFTIASAKETVNHVAVFTKKPDGAFNKAAQRLATLWRASITALKPEIKVSPDASNSKLLKVTATIKSNEPNDPAINVKTKLTVEGGIIRGDAIHNASNQGRVATGKPIPGSYNKPDTVDPVKITPGNPWITEWEVNSDNPDDCRFQLEAICEYQKTPDLQYSVCKYNKPLSVTISPDQVEPKGKMTLTIKVEPPQNVELEIEDLGLLVPKQGNENRNKDGILKVKTVNNGTFTGDFTVKDGTASGKYDIRVKAPKLNLEGIASFRVGKIDLSWVNYLRIVVSTASYENQNKERSYGITVDEAFKGSFSGNTFTGTLQPKKGYSGQGEVTVSVEPTDTTPYYRITSISVHSQVRNEKIIAKDLTITRAEELSLGGHLPENSGHIPVGDKVGIGDYGWWQGSLIGGTDTCNYIKGMTIVEKAQSAKGISTRTREHFCNVNSGISMGFAKSFHEAP